eukprot:gnl/Spiro4/29683_TR14566_c0_g1_i1.p3 gnl/Spiro4/29683_TR14566_c0_g1~~gnl/Spiro4/29683_TR14566_c0_g1_i1.p3  ORF type:complete len:158 (-),score=29.94 gnl/Spiro4/29683_TR14566_c0_g1_i1:200-643(-)
MLGRTFVPAFRRTSTLALVARGFYARVDAADGKDPLDDVHLFAVWGEKDERVNRIANELILMGFLELEVVMGKVREKMINNKLLDKEGLEWWENGQQGPIPAGLQKQPYRYPAGHPGNQSMKKILFQRPTKKLNLPPRPSSTPPAGG